MKLFNALMPGEHNYQMGKPMPGQTPQPDPMKAGFRRERGPLMNALGGFFEFAAPEAYDMGRQRKFARMESDALGAGKYDEAGRIRMQAGDFEGGAKIADYGQQQQAMSRQQEAQKLVTMLSSAAPEQLNQMARSDPAGFEQMAGVSSDEYLQSMTRLMQEGGLSLQDAHKFVLTQAQAEAGVTPQSAEGYTLAPGAARYDAAGNLIANNPVADKPQEQWQPIEAPAGMGGYWERSTTTGQTRRVAGPQSAGIRVNPDGSVQIGGPLDGVGYGSATKGKDSAIAFDADGNPVVTPGPQQATLNKAQNFLRAKKRTIGIVRDDISRALTLADDPWATGIAAAATKDLPLVGAVTPAGRLERRINTIKANIGFDKLDEMRQNSPTGGALGNVTEKEIYFLQAILGDLDNVQTEEDLQYVLRRIDDFYVDIQRQYEEAFAADYPSLAETADRRSGANQQVEGLNDLYEFMTPEERALFEGDQ